MKLNKNTIKVVCFGLIFFILFQNISWIFRDKSNAEFINGFEDEIPNSLDVLFLGSSMSYRQIYPLELWNEYGIASYNLGTSEQIIPVSYYVLEHALLTQKPKIVVLDMGMCIFEDKHFSDARLHQVWDNLSWSKAKVSSIVDLSNYPITFFFDIVQYHSRWKNLSKTDFKIKHDDKKGAGYYLGKTMFSDVLLVNDEDMKIPPDNVIKYLDAIIVLCKENNIDLLLTGMPTYQESQRRQQMFNYIERYVLEDNIAFVNFYDLIDELNISWENDFVDEVHLNYEASCKVTDYIGSYLKNNYELIDHRGEKKYLSWDVEYITYKEKMY